MTPDSVYYRIAKGPSATEWTRICVCDTDQEAPVIAKALHRMDHVNVQEHHFEYGYTRSDGTMIPIRTVS